MGCDEVESFRHFFHYYSCLSFVYFVRDFSTEWHFHEFNVNVIDHRVLAHANATACRHTNTATTITLLRLPVESLGITSFAVQHEAIRVGAGILSHGRLACYIQFTHSLTSRCKVSASSRKNFEFGDCRIYEPLNYPYLSQGKSGDIVLWATHELIRKSIIALKRNPKFINWMLLTRNGTSR